MLDIMIMDIDGWLDDIEKWKQEFYPSLHTKVQQVVDSLNNQKTGIPGLKGLLTKVKELEDGAES